MSGFISTVATGSAVLRMDARENCDEQIHAWARLPFLLNLTTVQGGFRSFVSPWWPARGSLLGVGDTAENPIAEVQRWSVPWTISGCNGRLGFVGYTRDANGSALGNCTVKCFRTSSDELVSSVTSDADGFYIATTPYSDAHYLVVQNPSAVPPVAGATINTITPA